MNNQWNRIKLGDLFVANYGKSLPKKLRINGQFNVYGSGGITDTHKEKLVDGPGIIIGRKGTVGSIYYEENGYYPIDTVYYIQESFEYDLKFLYYKLKTMNLEKMNTHSAVPGLNREHLYSQEMLIPNINEQKAIAKILSDLDEKIEINNKINENLEKIAQAIFKQWFVDFEFPNENGEPYKSSGGEMIESELGEIPKGWRTFSLGELIDIVDNRGKTPPQEKEKTDYPIIDVKALAGDGRVIDYKNCIKFVSKDTYENWFRSGHPKAGDILMSTVGSLAELKVFYGNIGCIAQNVVALRSKDISNLYLYQYLKNIKDTLVSYNIGSVQPSIKITHIIKHKILVPSNEIINKYHRYINKISKNIFINNKENEALIKLRDSLLPKLMSGEIRVPLH